MQSREVPPASPAAGLPKKTTEMGIRACNVHISAGLPIPCLFSSEKLPCEEKHSFYYLWGQPLLFIMLMLLCSMPSTSPLFHGEVFLCMKGGKKRKKNQTVCRISEEIKAGAEKGGLSAELGAVGAVCRNTQHQGARGQFALAFPRHPNAWAAPGAPSSGQKKDETANNVNSFGWAVCGRGIFPSPPSPLGLEQHWQDGKENKFIPPSSFLLLLLQGSWRTADLFSEFCSTGGSTAPDGFFVPVPWSMLNARRPCPGQGLQRRKLWTALGSCPECG